MSGSAWNLGIATLLLALAGLLPGCGGGGGGGGVAAAPPGGSGTSTEIVYSRHRNAAGQITPILSESGGGFDAAEVDSPVVAVDSGRPAGDKFLLYYEAQSATGVNTIGVCSANEEDFEVLVILRTLAVGLGAMGSGYEAGATDPAVIVDKSIPFGTGGRYRMWFEGRSGAAGADSSIIHCTSGDGIAWSGFTECTGLAASFASVRIADPTVVEDGGDFRMWFEAVDSTLAGGADGPGVIGYAESQDGVDWQIRDAAGATGLAASPVFETSAAGTFEAPCVGSPSVVLDPTVAVGSARRFLLWYEAADVAGNSTHTIGFATSADGLSWTDPQLPVLAPSSDSLVPLPFDSGDLEHPSAALDIAVPSNLAGHYLLWYSGDGENGASPNRIGFAAGRDGP
ncbi:MAG: hypothetical protein L0Z55_01290 [Planctomycetes bacterium]|nr:hypothetical protein [Planctomycetota bacterium]